MKRFPLMHSTVRSIPWEMLSPQENQATDNHGQTLERLAERGGLDATEALAILDGRKWRQMPNAEADAELRRRVDSFETNAQLLRTAELESKLEASESALKDLRDECRWLLDKVDTNGLIDIHDYGNIRGLVGTDDDK